MTVLPCSHDSDIEDILAAIRRQAAEGPQEAAPEHPHVDERPASACAGLCEDAADALPALLRRVDVRPSASVHPFKRPAGERLSDALRRATARVMRPATAKLGGGAKPTQVPADVAFEANRDGASAVGARMQRMVATTGWRAEATGRPDGVAEVPTRPQHDPIALMPVLSETSLAMPSGRLDSLDLAAIATADAAEMLRPLLKEWLAANMPRIIERALYLEMTGSGRVNRDVLES